MLKKGTLASPAIALARRVFPVPGGPTRSTPLGILPPNLLNFCGSFKNSIISCSSSFASSTPATSLKVILFLASFMRRALDFPKDSAFPPPACICRMKNIQIPKSRIIGNHEIRIFIYQLVCSGGTTTMRTPLPRRIRIRSGSLGGAIV